jgi:hypothetical protein
MIFTNSPWVAVGCLESSWAIFHPAGTVNIILRSKEMESNASNDSDSPSGGTSV